MKTSQSDTANRPNVYDFHHYRSFLRAWFSYRQATEPGFSLRALARMAGFSTSYLPLVLAGKRRLSPTMLEKMLHFLNLNPSEQSHLRQMHQLAESKLENSRRRAVDRIRTSRAYHQHNPEDADAFEYLSRWYHVVLREMVNLKGFSPRPDWIRKRLLFSPSREELQKALLFLKRAGFLEEKAPGGWKATKKTLSLGSELLGIALREFHRSIHRICFEALDETPARDHLILGYTFAIGHHQVEKLHAILRNAIKEIELLEEESGDEVHHVALIDAPLTQCRPERP